MREEHHRGLRRFAYNQANALASGIDGYNELLEEIETYQTQTAELVNNLNEIDEMMARVN